MGQQDYSLSASSHYWTTIMRSSRSKMFLYVVVLCVMCVVVFLLSSVHSNIKELETVNEKCQQQRDSLSAQLQVLYEHKSRLDKSLHQEKSDHKHTKEENERLHQELEVKSKQEKNNVEEFAKLEKQLSELKVSFSRLEDDKKLAEATMKEQYQSLQSQKDGEIGKLHAQLNDMLAEKEKLEQSISDNEWKVKQYMNDLYLLQLRYKQMESQLSEVNSHLQKVQHESKIGFPFKKFGSTTNNESGNSNLNEIPANENKNEKNRDGIPNEKKQNISQTDIQKEHPPNLPRPNIHPPVGNIMNSAINNSLNRLRNIESKQVLKEPEESAPAVNGVSPSVKNNTESPSQKASKKDGYLHKLNDVNNENVMNGAESNDIAPFGAGLEDLNHDEKSHSKEINNFPQVQPPNVFNNAGEQGEPLEMFHQSAMNIHKQQLEKPEDHQMANNLRMSKNVMPPPPIGNDVALPQQQDLLDRPPAELDQGHHNHFRSQHDFARRNNHNRFNGESHLNERLDGHQNPDGKQYVVDEDDDQDGENEDDQLIGGGPVARGRGYQDNDFEDQENLENNDNAAKDVEGVMVAPK